MPTYDFRNKTTGVEWEKNMRISELDAYKEENNAEILIKTVNIASGQGDNIDAKTDDGWKETLSKISEAHPDSELTKQYGRRKSHKDVKVEKIRKKHRNKALRKAQGINELK